MNINPGSSTTCTTCPYCGVGCGVDVQTVESRVITLSGNRDHPANFGRLCVKGAALQETLDTRTRLLRPQVDQKECSWQQALDSTARRLRAEIDRHGPNAVAFYLSGQLLTEDYYVANKLMKGFIGSGNIDTNSRLCMSSAVVGYKRAFGSDTVPCDYSDLEQADLLVIAGSNTAWAHPVIYQRIVAAKQRRPHMRVITIDPRRTATSDISDLHLSLAPGSDALLFNGLLHHLSTHERLDHQFIDDHTSGLEAALSSAATDAADLSTLSVRTGLPVDELQQFFQWFAATDKTVTLFSQGLNQSSSGSDNANAVINCHLATGRIGRVGTGPFSITGQPNAMGGREVGGLANQLAAHMEFGDQAAHKRIANFWQTDNLAGEPGLKAIDLFKAVADGSVRAVWVMGSNPAVSMPQADQVTEALRRCDLLIVSDCETNTETTKHADILLPALAWGEKSGTVTNSERRISRQRAFLPPPGDCKADWWILARVAQCMGYGAAFDYQSSHQIFIEHAALSAYENNGSRDFDIGALANLSESEYEQMQPTQWPCSAGKNTEAQKLFADGQFYTSDGRANFVAINAKLPATTSIKQPYIFNSGRLRDQWHTMTRTAKSPRLLQHSDEPFIEIHPDDAVRENIEHGQLLRATARTGAKYLAKAKISTGQRVGSLFAPIHWSGQFSGSAKASSLATADADPLSGQPAFKHSTASIAAVATIWQACIISRTPMPAPDCLYWCRIPSNQGERLELSGDSKLEELEKWLMQLSGASGSWITYHDNSMGSFRAACIDNNSLQALVFYSECSSLPARAGLSALFQAELNPDKRHLLLAGRLLEQPNDSGPIICACHNTGEHSIREAIKERSCSDTHALGRALGCGTGCGSCLPEIKALLCKYSHLVAPDAASLHAGLQIENT